jgi:hypothetical protein
MPVMPRPAVCELRFSWQERNNPGISPTPGVANRPLAGDPGGGEDG